VLDDLSFQLEGKTRQDPLVIMEALSERYGWTPEQIRQQPAEVIDAYVRIIDTKHRLERAQTKQHGRQ